MIAMSVDPYMRGRMNAGKSYAAAWEVGETMKGGAVGRVIDSRSPTVPEGALVLADAGWRDVAVLNANEVAVLPDSPASRRATTSACSACRASPPGSDCSVSPTSGPGTPSSCPAPRGRSAAWSVSSRGCAGPRGSSAARARRTRCAG